MSRTLRLAVGLAIAVALIAAASPSWAAAKKLAVFDLELQDASQEGELNGPRPDETERLKKTSAALEALFAEDPRYQLVDMTAFAERIAANRPLRTCHGCDIEMARDAGAELSLYGFVYKVSNLILDIHLFLRDVETGRVLKHAETSIRGNTDETWAHGVRWLMRNRLQDGQ